MNYQTEADAAGDIGLVLTGGGARGAYQVGVLSWLARNYPELNVPIITGVSAGAVNTAKLAARTNTFAQSVQELVGLWSELHVEDVFRVSPRTLGGNALKWGMKLMSGGSDTAQVRGLLDTQPLRELLSEVLINVNGELSGIEYNLEHGRLKAVAIMTTSYTTSQSIVWVQGREIKPWRRPNRRAIQTKLSIDHVMASAALPIFFPAVRIDDQDAGTQWYGDGGIRLAAPLSPVLHLGAHRVLAISTRYDRTVEESQIKEVSGYPPPAQVLGVLLNSVFLDVVDQDVLRLERMNELLERLEPEERNGLRPVQLLVMRPSRDLGTLAGQHEKELPRTFRFMTRGLGTRETRSPDILAMLMFTPLYLQQLIQLGEQDAERRAEELDAFVRGNGPEVIA